MRFGTFFILFCALVYGAYHMAQNKLTRPVDLSALHLGMTPRELEHVFGSPSASVRNQFTYILSDGSELFITLRDKLVSSAMVKFNRKIKIQDPEMRKLSLVQMDVPKENGNHPSWFFAGNPAEGLIYKITSNGHIESLTWVPPFTYGNTRPKQLQALLLDFQQQQTSNL